MGTATALETWNLLEDSPEYARLSAQQRAFLTVFIATAGDALSAAKVYRVASAENHRALAHQTLHNPNVVAALDVAGVQTDDANEPTRAQLLGSTRRQLRAAEPGSVAASRLNAQLIALTAPEKPETPAAKEPKAVPADATPLADKDGIVRGYRTADGQYVQLAEIIK